MIERKCLICGKTFLTFNSEIRRGRGKYCSHKCRGKSILWKNNPFWGKHHSEDTKKKLSEMHKGQVSWNKGKKCPQISKAKKGKSNGRIGYQFSEKTKEKLSKANRGKNNPQWKGGKIKCNNYWLIWKPEHPFANSKKYIRQSHLVMEQKLGHYLKSEEVIHHINGRKDDDRIENLYLFPNKSAHTSYEKNLWLTYKKWKT